MRTKRTCTITLDKQDKEKNRVYFNLNKDCSQQIVNYQITQYKQDVVIQFLNRVVPGNKTGYRGLIKEFSRKSQRRFQLLIRNTQHKFRFLVHLTYPAEYPVDIREAQRHLHTFLVWYRRKGGIYVWVKEFQSRGAVHFHICIDQWIQKNELSNKWYEIVGSGDINHLKSGTRVEAIKNRNHAAAYMCGYFKKSTQKVVPDNVENVGRFWGATRNLLVAKSIIDLKKVKLGDVKKVYRTLGKAYKAKLKSWGIKTWSWKNRGFIGWSMSEIYERISQTINFKGVQIWSQQLQVNS